MTVREYLLEQSESLMKEIEGYMARGMLFNTETYMHMIDEKTECTNFDAMMQIQAQFYRVNCWAKELPIEILQAVMQDE